MTEGEEKGFLLAIKRLLGLDTKRVDAISASNREKIRGVADAMEEHHGKCMAKCAEMHKCYKEMKGLHEEGTKIAESLREFADSHEPDVDDEDEAAKKPRKKGKKDDDTDDTGDTDDASPPKSADRTAIATKLAALKRPV